MLKTCNPLGRQRERLVLVSQPRQPAQIRRGIHTARQQEGEGEGDGEGVRRNIWPMCGLLNDGMFWIRLGVFGHGVCIRDMRRWPATFGERAGFKRRLTIGRIGITYMPPA
jgi:hypothetical protein